MFGNLRFITIFDNFLLPILVDLSAHFLYYFLTSSVLTLRCNNTLIFLWRVQCKSFKLGNLMKTPLFKIAFLNNQTHTCDNSFTFLIVTCLDYHFVQSDLVGSGFLKA